MIGYIIRMIIGVVIGQLVQGVFRLLTTPKRQHTPPRPATTPPPRTNRIQIDRKNIVEGKFEDIPEE